MKNRLSSYLDAPVTPKGPGARAKYFRHKQRRERQLRRDAERERDRLKDELDEAQDRVRQLEAALADQVISE